VLTVQIRFRSSERNLLRGSSACVGRSRMSFAISIACCLAHANFRVHAGECALARVWQAFAINDLRKTSRRSTSTLNASARAPRPLRHFARCLAITASTRHPRGKCAWRAITTATPVSSDILALARRTRINDRAIETRGGDRNAQRAG